MELIQHTEEIAQHMKPDGSSIEMYVKEVANMTGRIVRESCREHLFARAPKVVHRGGGNAARR